MERVGIRELRQRASELLRRVEAGESIEVTCRGRPVAILTPFGKGPMGRLRASGDLMPARADMTELLQLEPLRLEPGREPPSRMLERLRGDER